MEFLLLAVWVEKILLADRIKAISGLGAKWGRFIDFGLGLLEFELLGGKFCTLILNFKMNGIFCIDW